MKKLLLLTLLFMSGMTLWAQNNTENKKQIISEVKQAEEQYIYADKTSRTVEEALEQAQELLLREVVEYLQQSGDSIDDAATFVKDQMVTITVQRGDKFRAFVYIDKQQNKSAETVKEPKTDNAKSIVVEEEKPQEKPVEAIKVEAEKPTRPAETTVTPMLQQIASMTTRLEVYDYITQLQKKGEKVTFVNHPDAQGMASLYLLLYKRGGTIEAILTPPDAQGQRYNLATGLPDAQDNYPATSLNGFTLK